LRSKITYGFDEHNFVLTEDTNFTKMKAPKSYHWIKVLCIFVKNI
jgi:hypothetical protein